MRLKTIIMALAWIGIFTQAFASDFPVTLEHKYGTTVIEEKPKRIVSLSMQNHDNYLALGVQPVAIRYWFGDYEFGVWPWAEEKLVDPKPVVLKGNINIEQIAALEPDLIEAMWSGLTQDQYELLSQIAPVVPPLKGYEDFAMPWKELARTTGLITGYAEEADAQIAAIEARMAQIREDKPEWQGATAAVAYYWNDAPGAYTSLDIRPTFLKGLGLVTPKAIDDVAGAEKFAVTFSAEDISPLEADVLIWFGDAGNVELIKNLALRPKLKAYQEGREIYVEPYLASAFSHGSLLSLPIVLDQIVPLIDLAIDGDPNTVVTSTQAIGLLE